MCFRSLFSCSAVLIAAAGLSETANSASIDSAASVASVSHLANGGTTLIASRKGTRNYQPSSDDGPASDDAQPRKNGAANRDLDHCIASWDRETHMSKNEWRETCRRVLQDRAKSGV